MLFRTCCCITTARSRAVLLTCHARTLHTPNWQLTVLRLTRSGPSAFVYSQRLASSQPTITSRLLYPFQRVHHFFKNDPFAKVSVVFGGVVLGILLIIEAFTKTAAKIKPQIAVLPPQCSHSIIQRTNDLNTLVKHLPSPVTQRLPIIGISGPSGSGKTLLATQVVEHFLKSGFRIPFKSSAKPIVLSLDACDLVNLDYTLRYAASVLGIPSEEFYPSQSCQPVDRSSSSSLEDQLLYFFNAIFTKLLSQKSKWLLVVDGVEQEAAGVVDTALRSVSGKAKSRKGCVVITSRHCDQWLPSVTKSVSLDNGLTEAECSSLFLSLVGASELSSQSQDYLTKLSQQLCHLPMSVALAGLTVKLYTQFLEASDPTLSEKPTDLALSSFCEVLSGKLSGAPGCEEVMKTTIELYIETLSAADPYFLYAVDFLTSIDPSFPVPISAITQHLSHPFYALSSLKQFLSPLADPLEVAPLPPSPPSYLEMIKSKIPFIPQSSSPLPTPNGGQTLQKLAETQAGRWSPPDPLISLRKSPFVKSQSFSGLELISLHPSVVGYIQGHFLRFTVPKLQEAHVRGAKDQFDRGSWFKQFRSFNEESILASYLKSLPGLGEGGVLTEEKFKTTSSMNPQLMYSEYLHLVSHSHRVCAALTKELNYLSRDAEDLQLCRYIQPHLSALSHSPFLPTSDQLRCQSGLLSIDAAFSPKSENIYARYNSILDAERRTVGSSSLEVANTLTQMAELKYYAAEYHSAEQLLQSAVSIHNKVPLHKRSAEQSLDLAVTMSTLGLVYSALGNKQRSKDYLEQSLGLYQSIPSSGEVSRKQRKQVASTVTDLGHVYISLGDVTMAKRYLDLALTAHRNIHPGSHPEVSRTLTVMSVVYALMGDAAESRRLRKEAQTNGGTMMSDVL